MTSFKRPHIRSRLSGMQSWDLVPDSESPLWETLRIQNAVEENAAGEVELTEDMGWRLLESDDSFAKQIGEAILRLIYIDFTADAS